MKFNLFLLLLASPIYADTLAFEGTVPITNNKGTCTSPRDTISAGDPVAIYWGANYGPYYYYSIMWGERGQKFYIKRSVPKGNYNVTVRFIRMQTRAKFSCPVTITIPTKPDTI